ncbi:protein spdB [Streptomyces sp. NPDC057136]|uniref:protein spdB n=1 Tax=Streptomyces sp. NPDC057136 TaxID=3346029 RepID=UPI003638BBDC
MKGKTVLPAVAMTAVSMVLTLAVVVMWLGTAMPWPVALVVGLGIDGGWLATLAYERRLAAQGDHSNVVTGVGWSFGLIATGVLIAHALTAEGSAGAWLAVAWLPVAAKALWLVHGLWERTALTGQALDAIQGIQQEARDEAAVARARLRSEAATEETRLTAVTQAGARVAQVQAKTANTLSRAWSTLETTRKGEGTGRALTSVTTRVTPGVTPRWELPVWGPTESVTQLALETAPVLTYEALDALVEQIRHSETPALSYREMASRFRSAGHSASEVRLRSAWKRMVA